MKRTSSNSLSNKVVRFYPRVLESKNLTQDRTKISLKTSSENVLNYSPDRKDKVVWLKRQTVVLQSYWDGEIFPWCFAI